MARDNSRVAKAREVAERYARNLGHLKDNGHQLISSWDTARIAERAASWACQFVRSDDPDPGKFFEKKLDYAAFRAGLSLQNVDGTDEQSTPQNADSTDEQNIPQNAVGDDGQNIPQAS